MKYHKSAGFSLYALNIHDDVLAREPTTDKEKSPQHCDIIPALMVAYEAVLQIPFQETQEIAVKIPANWLRIAKATDHNCK